eukprot:6486141-Amphidinium_carterae.1
MEERLMEQLRSFDYTATVWLKMPRASGSNTGVALAKEVDQSSAKTFPTRNKTIYACPYSIAVCLSSRLTVGSGGLGGIGSGEHAVGFVQNSALEDNTERPHRHQSMSPPTNMQSVHVSWGGGAFNASRRQQEEYQQKLAEYELNRAQDTHRLQQTANWVQTAGSRSTQHMQAIKPDANREVLVIWG